MSYNKFGERKNPFDLSQKVGSEDFSYKKPKPLSDPASPYVPAKIDKDDKYMSAISDEKAVGIKKYTDQKAANALEKTLLLNEISRFASQCAADEKLKMFKDIEYMLKKHHGVDGRSEKILENLRSFAAELNISEQAKSKQFSYVNPFDYFTQTEVEGVEPDSFVGSDYETHYIKVSKPSENITTISNISKDVREQLDKEMTKWENEVKTTPAAASVKEVDPSGWIQLYSGRKFFPMNPDIDAIDINDIAQSLSNMCRFTGHCKSFYSVAQHSVMVSYLVGEHAMWGLLHDASEAYLVDMPRPIKRLKELQPFRDIENNVMLAICEKFGLSKIEPPIVKDADTRMLATEARDLMSPLHPDWHQPCEPLPFTIITLNPTEAKNLFLNRYRELVGKQGYDAGFTY